MVAGVVRGGDRAVRRRPRGGRGRSKEESPSVHLYDAGKRNGTADVLTPFYRVRTLLLKCCFLNAAGARIANTFGNARRPEVYSTQACRAFGILRWHLAREKSGKL